MEQNIIKKHAGNPNWKKGMISPNPLGAKITYKKLTNLFTTAFLRDKEKNQKDLFEFAFERARESDKVLITLLNKFVPDLIKGEGFGSKNLTQIFARLTIGELRGLIGSITSKSRDRISQAGSIQSN